MRRKICKALTLSLLIAQVAYSSDYKMYDCSKESENGKGLSYKVDGKKVKLRVGDANYTFPLNSEKFKHRSTIGNHSLITTTSSNVGECRAHLKEKIIDTNCIGTMMQNGPNGLKEFKIEFDGSIPVFFEHTFTPSEGMKVQKIDSWRCELEAI